MTSTLDMRHLEAIKLCPDGGYELPTETREHLDCYLRPFFGFSLAQLTTHRELVYALRYCNAREFEQLIAKPAPTAAVCFTWRRLRSIGR